VGADSTVREVLQTELSPAGVPELS